MPKVRLSQGLYRVVWARLAFQFDPRAADNLLGGLEKLEASFGRGGRLRHLWRDGRLLLTFRPRDGFASLTMYSGELLRASTEPPRYRVVVRRGVEVRGAVFVAQVAGGDETLRPGDEVIVVDEDDRLLGVGRLRIPLSIIRGLRRGEVVRVR